MSGKMNPLAASMLVLLVFLVELSEQHGRMIEPPARNAMWRVGFNTTPNYEDSELFCGGIVNQWKINKGKCGICGDSYSVRRPRPYETGGKLVRNITTRVYPPGGVIDVVIQLVANHLGTFQFSLCPRNSVDEIETEECFIPLTVKGEEVYRLKTHRKGAFNLPVQLPKEVSCDKCILRWHWKSANNWGVCENGNAGIGCGPQETYRNCADIVVRHEMGIRGPFISRDYSRSKQLGQLVIGEMEPSLEEQSAVINDDFVTFHKLQ